MADGADWPMWRGNAAHTGSTPRELPSQLSLQWTRTMPPLVPGWPDLVDLIGVADEAVTLLAKAYLSVNYNLAGDGSWAASSLQVLLRRAGLIQHGASE